MSARPDTLRRLEPSERSAALDHAAAVLRDGGRVVMPTGRRYALAWLAAPDVTDAQYWFAPSTQALLACAHHRVHRRLIKRLTPGPVAFQFVPDTDHLRDLAKQLGLDPITAIVPDHHVAAALLNQIAHKPVVGRPVPHGSWSNLPQADAILDDGPPPPSPPLTPSPNKDPTTIRLEPDGSYRLISTGETDPRSIEKQLTRLVLFVCTGNTCRSPMAEALARDILSQQPDDGFVTNVRSAGIAASPGPASTQAVRALARMGIDAGEHRARALTPRLVADAEVIYAMTTSHVRTILAMDPGARDRVHLLDPDGRDVDDPFGGSVDVYEQTARLLRELVGRRLQEIEP